MASDLDRLKRQVAEMQVQLDSLFSKLRAQDESGAPKQPIQALYLIDNETKAVGKVTFDKGAEALKIEEV